MSSTHRWASNAPCQNATNKQKRSTLLVKTCPSFNHLNRYLILVTRMCLLVLLYVSNPNHEKFLGKCLLTEGPTKPPEDLLCAPEAYLNTCSRRFEDYLRHLRAYLSLSRTSLSHTMEYKANKGIANMGIADTVGRY